MASNHGNNSESRPISFLLSGIGSCTVRNRSRETTHPPLLAVSFRTSQVNNKRAGERGIAYHKFEDDFLALNATRLVHPHSPYPPTPVGSLNKATTPYVEVARFVLITFDR